MPTVILVRHAKSDWPMGVDDFDRPLTSSGKRDAEAMAEKLKHRFPELDQLLSSPAQRARTTARFFAESYGFEIEDIQLIPELYHPDIYAFCNILSEIDSSVESVAIFSHNNGLTDYANFLGIIRIDEVPTCGVVAFRFNGLWSDIMNAEKKFLFFDRPDQ